MKTSRLGKLVVGLTAVGLLVLEGWAQQPPPVTDIGQFDKGTAEKAFKKPYSPYAGRILSATFSERSRPQDLPAWGRSAAVA
jgi:hypothetical protein